MARPNPNGNGQPPMSFKTVPGRNPTQKWNQAPSYNYDGDDWGGFDPYDEYAREDDHPAPPARGPQPPYAQPARRQNSFDRGIDNERRQFSSGYGPPEAARRGSPAASASDRVSQDSGRTGSDFAAKSARVFSNPAQVPAPLNMRGSPAPSAGPPRLNSFGSDTAAPETLSTSAKSEKPLPFIRPADIYKRMAEQRERARQSQDGGRPSMDSVQREATSPPQMSAALASDRSGNGSPSSGMRRPSLDPVNETTKATPSTAVPSPLPVTERPRSSERAYSGFKVDNPILARALGAEVAQSAGSRNSVERAGGLDPQDNQPRLPPVSRISGFGNFGSFLQSDTAPATSAVPAFTQSAAPASPSVDPAAEILAERHQEVPVRLLGRGAQEHAGGVPATEHNTTNTTDASRSAASHDPAAEILAERHQDVPAHSLGRGTHEHAGGILAPADTTSRTRDGPRVAPSQDSAADILAERHQEVPAQSLGRFTQEHAGGVLPPTVANASAGPTNDSQSAPSYDPAAEILAERQRHTPAEHLGRAAHEHPSGLAHQPSAGYRSMVNRAFDSEADTTGLTPMASRDTLQTDSAGGVGRSNTISTGSISPIMSHMPSAGIAQMKQRDNVVSPIAEESRPESRIASDATMRASSHSRDIARKPSPSLANAADPNFEPGYRRRINAPSPGNSPARTPALEDANTRRISGPQIAERHAAEPPDVPPEAPELPVVILAPAETPASEALPGLDTHRDLPIKNRDRSGTDYSMREADLAQQVSNAPDKVASPVVAEAAAFNQDQYLRTHPAPASPGPTSPSAIGTGFSKLGYGLPRATTPGSGRNSPVPGNNGGSYPRVKAIVDQYHQIDDASRRNSTASVSSSKSSWSNFRGSTEDLPGLKRKTTEGSMLSGDRTESPVDARDETLSNVSAASPTRPFMGDANRLESFRPQLPGQWVSYAPTPVSEDMPAPPPVAPVHDATSQMNKPHHDQLSESPPTPRVEQSREPETVDFTPNPKKSQLRSSDTPTITDGKSPTATLASLKNAGDALGAAFMSSVGYGSHETRDFAAPKAPAAPVDVPEMRPHRETGDVFRPNAPELNRGYSEAPSFASDITNITAVSRSSSRPPTPPAKDTPGPSLAPAAAPGGDRPISSYFSGAEPAAPAPLKFGRQGQNAANDSSNDRPKFMPSLSTDTSASDLESDRLRKDIVRSLGAEKVEKMKRESIMEDVERTEDALAAPANARAIETGQSLQPVNESAAGDARSALPSQSTQAKPGFLDQRFSWENRPAGALYAPMAVVGELEGDEGRASYERPRSAQGLHVINTAVGAESEPSTADTPKPLLGAMEGPIQAPALIVNDASPALDGDEGPSYGSHSDGQSAERDLVSPITKSQENLGMHNRHSGDGNLADMAPSPISEPDHDRFASMDTRAGPMDTAASTGSPPTHSLPSSPSSKAATKQSGQRIPPFREILAIKSTPDRIQAYSSTRETFANMNTGLNDWVSAMMAQHPEHADVATRPPLNPSATIGRGRGHKPTASIANFTKQFTGGAEGPGPSERKASNPAGYAAMRPKTGGGEGSGVDVKELQMKGKDMMKSAGAGAKGLFAKGKSRFGRGEKVENVEVIRSPADAMPVPEMPTPMLDVRNDYEKKEPGNRASSGVSVWDGTRGINATQGTVEPQDKIVGEHDIDASANGGEVLPIPATQLQHESLEESSPTPPAAIVEDSTVLQRPSRPEQSTSATSRGAAFSTTEPVEALVQAQQPTMHSRVPPSISAEAGRADLLALDSTAPAAASADDDIHGTDLTHTNEPVRESARSPPLTLYNRKSEHDFAQETHPVAVAASASPTTPSPSSPTAEQPRRSILERLRAASRSASRSATWSRPGSLVIDTSTPTQSSSRNPSRPNSTVLGKKPDLIPSADDSIPTVPNELRRRSEERSRSRSREQSRSRRASMRGSEVWAQSREQLPAMPTTPSNRRREAWEDDEGISGAMPGVPERGERLGILPSPTTLNESPEKVRRGSGMGAAHRDLQGMGALDGESMLHTNKMQAIPPKSLEAPMQQIMQPSASPVGQEAFDAGKVAHSPDAIAAPAIRPTQERAFSARDFLPSQQRNRQSRPASPSGSPMREAPSHAPVAEDELYDVTPTVHEPATHVPAEADELYDVTPTGSRGLVGDRDRFFSAEDLRGDRTQQAFIGPHQVADPLQNQQMAASEQDLEEQATDLVSPLPGYAAPRTFAGAADNYSLVSAQSEHYHDAYEERVGRAASHRSSVSSITQPSLLAAPQALGRSQENASTSTLHAGPEIATPTPITHNEPILGAASVPPYEALERAHSPDVQPVAALNLPRQRLIPDSQQGQLDDRPMSFLPLGTDDTGAPLQETLTRGEADGASTPVQRLSPEGRNVTAGIIPTEPPRSVEHFAQSPPPQTLGPRDGTTMNSDTSPQQLYRDGEDFTQLLPAQPFGPREHMTTTAPMQPSVYRPSVSRTPSGYDRLRMPQARQDAPTVPTRDDSPPKRLSYHRGPPDSTIAGIPPPSQLHENYDGLIDPQVDNMAAELARNERPQQQEKRRSGIWNSVRRNTSDYSRESSLIALSPEPTRSKTVSKQRASSTPLESSEPKKKRFSGLGSVFGRSNTKSNVTSKANKLTKTQPRPPSPVQRYFPTQTAYPPRATRDYDAYEAQQMKQYTRPAAVPGYQRPPQPQYEEPYMSSPYAQKQPSVPISGNSAQPRRSFTEPAAPYEWYGPQQQNFGNHAQAPIAADSISPQPIRQLHSAQQQPQSRPAQQQHRAPSPQRPYRSPPPQQQYSSPSPQQSSQPLQRDVPAQQGTQNMPPIRRSYDQSQYPSLNGIPMITRDAPATREGPEPRRATYGSGSSYANDSFPQTQGRQELTAQPAPEPRRTTYGNDNFPQAPGRQDYQTQYWQQRQPADQRYVSPPPVSALSGEQSRWQMSPVSATSGGEQERWSSAPQHSIGNGPRAVSWGPRPLETGPRQFNGPPPAALGASRSPPPRDPRGSGQYEHNGVGRPPYDSQELRERNAHPSPPPDEQAMRPPESRYSQPVPQQAGRAQRYVHVYHEERPMTYQRGSSEYTGRRDDAGVSEEQLMNMRGASYPGQEWRPDLQGSVR
ncbi:hypothetical protein B0A48_17123 [Cryoendolithus antarcticus]|uniref:Uncharacterized protein n=1 Tax=Cryoendolithus antarcticus TaxID=1507870 RepID=A0A1V8SBV8_9PEZI|nr:hypothetical protein B0A48_17123 [Cryoendolithus antarcticus]